MNTLFEKFVLRSGLTIFSFDRGPTLNEIGRMAISHQVISLVLSSRIFNYKKYYCNYIIDLTVSNLRPKAFELEPSFLFQAEIISTWPFVVPSPADRSIQGCLDQRREGFFIFPKERGIKLF